MPADPSDSGPDSGPGSSPDSGPRQTLAMRLAERNRQRALRAERLARLRPAAAPPAGFDEEPSAARPGIVPPGIVPPGIVPRIVPEAGSGAGVGSGIVAREALPPAADGIDSAEALEEFLRALTGAQEGPRKETPRPAPPPGALLRFQRPDPEPEADPEPGDLDRLTGAGPGLIWALERAGIRRLADLAPLGPEDLVARLGPIGRLVPAEAWLATAREASAPAR